MLFFSMDTSSIDFTAPVFLSTRSNGTCTQIYCVHGEHSLPSRVFCNITHE